MGFIIVLVALVALWVWWKKTHYNDSPWVKNRIKGRNESQSELDDAVSNMEATAGNDTVANNIQFSNLVERSIEDVQRLKTNSVTIK